MTEVWKPIVGWGDCYEVSNLGRVRSLTRVITYSNGRKRKHKGQILRGAPDTGGYLQVPLKKNGNGGPLAVHRLVARAFLGDPPDGLELDHINGDKSDNRVENLEYVTHSENQMRAYALGLCAQPKGSKSPASKLSEEDVDEMLRLRQDGHDLGFISERFSVGTSQVCRILSGQSWSHYTGINSPQPIPDGGDDCGALGAVKRKRGDR